jgi:hypothetical protein
MYLMNTEGTHEGFFGEREAVGDVDLFGCRRFSYYGISDL